MKPKEATVYFLRRNFSTLKKKSRQPAYKYVSQTPASLPLLSDDIPLNLGLKTALAKRAQAPHF
jgi:hypothetical protein